MQQQKEQQQGSYSQMEGTLENIESREEQSLSVSLSQELHYVRELRVQV